jgi:hypothetical protein
VRPAEHSELPVKSAFSETITRNGIIEYNLVGITDQITLVFARDESAAAIELEDVDFKLATQAEDLQLEDHVLEMIKRGEGVGTIISEDDDDIRILDSLPNTVKDKKKGATSYPQDDKFGKLLESI